MDSTDSKLINNDHYNILKDAAGSKVVGAEYLMHFSDNADTNVIAVRMRFSSGLEAIIRCGSDGESLKVTHEILEEIDLGDFGRIVVVDSKMVDPASLSDCLDVHVKRVVLEIGDGLLKAIRMECEGKTAFFSNFGDVLNFDEARFQAMLAEEEWGVLTTVSYPSQ